MNNIDLAKLPVRTTTLSEVMPNSGGSESHISRPSDGNCNEWGHSISFLQDSRVMVFAEMLLLQQSNSNDLKSIQINLSQFTEVNLKFRQNCF